MTYPMDDQQLLALADRIRPLVAHGGGLATIKADLGNIDYLRQTPFLATEVDIEAPMLNTAFSVITTHPVHRCGPTRVFKPTVAEVLECLPEPLHFSADFFSVELLDEADDTFRARTTFYLRA